MKPLITPQEALLLALVMSRVIGVFLSLPFFNTPFLPHNIKVLLVLALSFFIVKNMHITLPLNDFTLLSIFLAIVVELLLGFALGLLVNFFIAAFSYAAEIISYFMGLTIANSFDPAYGQVSVLSKFFILLFFMLFFISGAYGYFISVLFMSFEYIPLGVVSFEGGFWRYVLEHSFDMFVIAFKLAFPFALIVYLINLSLALVNRLIPQINVFIVGLPLQIFVGFAALAIGVSVIVYVGMDYLHTLAQSLVAFVKGI